LDVKGLVLPVSLGEVNGVSEVAQQYLAVVGQVG
jgi:hypothetical protein